MTAERWRAGRKVGRTLYLDDRLVGMVDTPELAQAICDAMNRNVRAAGEPVVHVVTDGGALCGLPGFPKDWPPGHLWISKDEADEASCAQCRSEAGVP